MYSIMPIRYVTKWYIMQKYIKKKKSEKPLIENATIATSCMLNDVLVLSLFLSLDEVSS